MRLYRVEVLRGDGWSVQWTVNSADANKVARQVAPAVVDVVEVPSGKASLVELLNLADANREALGQEFAMAEVRRWP